jgi:hypothetical protein
MNTGGQGVTTRTVEEHAQQCRGCSLLAVQEYKWTLPHDSPRHFAEWFDRRLRLAGLDEAELEPRKKVIWGAERRSSGGRKDGKNGRGSLFNFVAAAHKNYKISSILPDNGFILRSLRDDPDGGNRGVSNWLAEFAPFGRFVCSRVTWTFKGLKNSFILANLHGIKAKSGTTPVMKWFRIEGLCKMLKVYCDCINQAFEGLSDGDQQIWVERRCHGVIFAGDFNCDLREHRESIESLGYEFGPDGEDIARRSDGEIQRDEIRPNIKFKDKGKINDFLLTYTPKGSCLSVENGRRDFGPTTSEPESRFWLDHSPIKASVCWDVDAVLRTSGGGLDSGELDRRRMQDAVHCLTCNREWPSARQAHECPLDPPHMVMAGRLPGGGGARGGGGGNINPQ